MKRIAIFALLLAGCGQSELERAQELVASQTREPSAAQFQNVTRCQDAPEIVVGKVNGKNAFGGYTGFKTFFVDNGTVIIADDEIANSPEGRRLVVGLVERCGQAQR